MWWRLQQSPWWVLSVVQGLIYATIVATGTAVISDDSFISRLPGAVIGGLVFGALMGPATARIRRRQFAGIPGSATEEQQKAGAHAARRGAVPTDSITRQVAVHLVTQRLNSARTDRRRQIIIFGLFAAAYVAAGIWGTAWAWLAAALFAYFLILAWAEPARLARRLQVLSER